MAITVTNTPDMETQTMKYLLPLVLTLHILITDAKPSVADDPCEEMDNIIISFVSSLPSLSADDLAGGRFKVSSRERYMVIRYVVREKVMFEQSVPGRGHQFQAVTIGGFSTLYFRTEGLASCCFCSYLVVSSPQRGKFLLLPSRPILGAWRPWQSALPADRVQYYQNKDRMLAQVLYQPLLGGQPVDYLQNFKTEDIDSDGEIELVTTEYPEWVAGCNYSNAGRPFWRSIYHLHPHLNALENVSQNYPKVYVEIEEHLLQSLRENVGAACGGQAMDLLDKARNLARNRWKEEIR
jgi:hypothetical protein